MKLFLWYLGRLLQILALIQTGYALLVGLQTSDARQELQLMLVGVAEFLIGYFLVSFTGDKG